MRCPHCGFDDPEDLAFCSECGRPRGSAPLPGAVSGPPAGPAQAARRASRPPPAAPPGPFAAAARVGAGSGQAARLVGLDGPLEGVEFVLDRPEMGIGRWPDCDIRVPENGVSRLHARVRASGDGYVIEDAGSANGTWVNDACVEGALPLAEGDVIRVGPCSFRFDGGQHAQASALDPRSGQGVSPGAMTMVADIGHDPSPFGGEPLLAEDTAANRFPTPPMRPAPGFPPAVGPDRQPAAVVPPAPRPEVQSIPALREQLSGLNRDLGPYLQRLEAVAASLAALEGRLGEPRSGDQPAPSSRLVQELFDGLAAAGGADQYRALQNLLDELRASPTDLRLLLRLSDQLPLISALVQAYLRTVTAPHDRDRG